MGWTVFFDLDGTLCRPRAPFDRVFFSACAPLFDANAMLEPERLLRAWGAALEEEGAATTESCLAHALDRCGATARQSVAQQSVAQQCAATLNKQWAGAQTLAPGAATVLSALDERGIPMGIITNGPSDAQRAVVRALGLEAWCRWIIVSGDAQVGVRKPQPGIFLRAMSASRVEATETWYVGDAAVNDVGGAAGVGMRTCWLCAPEQSLPDGVPPPNARITALPDLLGLLTP